MEVVIGLTVRPTLLRKERGGSIRPGRKEAAGGKQPSTVSGIGGIHLTGPAYGNGGFVGTFGPTRPINSKSSWLWVTIT